MTERKPLHVHIGAGGIGLGCVLPFFADKRRMIVVQRVPDKDPYSTIIAQHRSEVTVRVLLPDSGGEVRHRLRVVSACQSDAVEAVNRYSVEHILLFVNPSEYERFASVFSGAVSLSTAVRDIPPQRQIIQALNSIRFDAARPNLFLFENRYATIDPIANEKEPVIVKAESINIQEVVVDRICSPPRRAGDHEILISSESFWEFVAKASSGIESQYWRVARSEEEWKFYRQRKQWLVNSIHVAVTFLAFDYLRRKNFTLMDWSTQYLPIVLDAMYAEYADVIHTLLQAQAVRLITKTDPRVLKHIFGEISEELIYRQLLTFAHTFQARMRRVPDAVSRVFGLKGDGSANDFRDTGSRKYDDAFGEFVSWVSDHGRGLQHFQAIDVPTPDEVAALAEHLETVFGLFRAESVRRPPAR